MNLLKVCALVAVAALALAPSAVAQGVCMNDDTYCNDDYLSYEALDGTYSVHGYEYGCGYNDRQLFGSIKLAGGFAYFGYTFVSPGYDNGMQGMRSMVIDMSSKTGTGVWNYMYMSGGALTAHGGPSSYTMATCSPPPIAAAPSGPDNSN